MEVYTIRIVLEQGYNLVQKEKAEGKLHPPRTLIFEQEKSDTAKRKFEYPIVNWGQRLERRRSQTPILHTKASSLSV